MLNIQYIQENVFLIFRKSAKLNGYLVRIPNHDLTRIRSEVAAIRALLDTIEGELGRK